MCDTIASVAVDAEAFALRSGYLLGHQIGQQVLLGQHCQKRANKAVVVVCSTTIVHLTHKREKRKVACETKLQTIAIQSANMKRPPGTLNIFRLSFSSFKCCSFVRISASRFFTNELRSLTVNAFFNDCTDAFGSLVTVTSSVVSNAPASFYEQNQM